MVERRAVPRGGGSWRAVASTPRGLPLSIPRIPARTAPCERLAMPSTLHMIGNAHLDPVWLWRWPEGCAEAIATCWAAVDLLEEQPGFIFTRGEAVIYRWIEELEPALFGRIRHFVQEGRWAIVNGWWVQPDCNLPPGESFIRQALYGKAYFRETFGVDVTVGYNVDSFGHAGTLPMLLRHTGFEHYVFMRPREHEKGLPAALFDWVAPDGSCVLTFRVPIAYHTVRRPPHPSRLAGLPLYDGLARQTLAERLPYYEALAEQAGYPFMCFYGVGNHGGGPTREDLAAIRAAQAEGHDLVFSDPARYFAAVADVPRPEVQDEMQFHAIGCYSAVSAIKALNRRAEARLAQAEAASALATWHVGAPYPREKLRNLWETLLFNHFHDILCGTSIPSAMRDAIEGLGGVIQGAEEVLNAGLRRLAATVAPGPDPADASFLVFNLTGAEQDGPIEHEPWLDKSLDEQPRCLLDEAGVEVPYQVLPAEGFLKGLHRILFAPRVPPFGYRLYRFVARKPTVPMPSTLCATHDSLENVRWRLTVDPATGGIARLTDKRTGREVFAGTAHLAIVVDDPSDTWSHGLDRFGFEGHVFECAGVDVIEAGPLRAGLRVRTRADDSIVTSTYLLHDDPALPLEIRVWIDWRGKNQLLRLCYPVALSAPTFRYEVPYGSIERLADGREWPGQRWVLVSGTDGYSLALANDAKYSYAAYGNSLYVTALRSPVYAHHDPYTLVPGGAYPYTDQGEQVFTLRLFAGQGLSPLDAFHLADELTRPPVATPHVSRVGQGPQHASLLPLEARSSVATWLKATEDGAGLIVRVLEANGKPDTVVLPAPGDRREIGR